MLLYVFELLTRSDAVLQNLLVRVLFAFPLHFLSYIMDILPRHMCSEPGPENDWYARRLDHTFLKSQHVMRAKSDFSQHQRSTVFKPNREKRRLSCLLLTQRPPQSQSHQVPHQTPRTPEGLLQPHRPPAAPQANGSPERTRQEERFCAASPSCPSPQPPEGVLAPLVRAE